MPGCNSSSALRFDEQDQSAEMPRPLSEILRSLRIISYWVAALGMEPELLRLDRALETYDSPFVTQNEELIAYIDTYPASAAQAGGDDQRRQAPARALRPVPWRHRAHPQARRA